jgi:hypothetical protein
MVLKSVLRIRNILVRIRLLSVIDLQEANKDYFFYKVFLPVTFERTLTSFFKSLKNYSRHQGFFLLFLLDDRRIRSQILSRIRTSD